MESPDNAPFQPNEDLLRTLTAMGISSCIAEEALFCTGNESLDAALGYVFSNNLFESPAGESISTGEDAGDGEAVNAGMGSYKMAFVVNTALKMGVGKVAAQVAHACLGLYRELLDQDQMDVILNHWENTGEKKVVLRGTDHLHLLGLYEKARASTISCHLIHDAGRTQIPPDSVTALSLFGLEDDINKITGTLSLL